MDRHHQSRRYLLDYRPNGSKTEQQDRKGYYPPQDHNAEAQVLNSPHHHPIALPGCEGVLIDPSEPEIQGSDAGDEGPGDDHSARSNLE